MRFLLFTGSADKFLGNQTHKDYFKLLRTDGDSLLIGARNVVYNLSLPYLVENPEQVSPLFNISLICRNGHVPDWPVVSGVRITNCATEKRQQNFPPALTFTPMTIDLIAPFAFLS